ncbi:MAG: hypothetical protein HKL82_01255 [Acidimicrobiaceae bacterium]|nr:hypothetical protein [Acidimicrobiaceae bacterium]
MRRLIIASAVALVGLFPIAATALTGSVASASPSASPTYSPVPLDLANLINNSSSGISLSTHFEQTLLDASGNYWVDTTDGKLIEISGSAPHVSIGYIDVGGSLFDAVAGPNDQLFIINQGSSSCPVEVISVAPSNLTLNQSTLQFSLGTGPTCITPLAGNSFGSSSSYSITSDGANIFFTQDTNQSGISGGNSTLWMINPNTLVATPYPLSVSIDQAMTVAGGYLFAGSSSHNRVYQFKLSGMSGALNTPVDTYTVSGSGSLGDFQYVTAPAGASYSNELWFVREFTGQVGYVPVASSPSANTIAGTDYQVAGAPNSETESMTLDPATNNLWIASGNVNGISFPNVSFGYFNPGSLPTSGTINPTFVNTPNNVSLSADDFVLENGNPTYFDNSPLNALTKTDNVGGKTLDSQSFNFTINPSIASTSPINGYGSYELIDPMPTGITVTGVSAPMVIPLGQSIAKWNCTRSKTTSTAGGVGTVKCYLFTSPTTQFVAGTQLPPITITAYTTGTAGVPITNTATLSNFLPINLCGAPESFNVNSAQNAPPTCVVAPAVSASDTITPYSAPVTPPAAPSVILTKTAAQPIVSPGGIDSFTIAGAFTGNINAPATVTDTLPTGLSLDGTPSITGSGFASASCSTAGNTVTCTLVPSVTGVSSPAIGIVTVPVSVNSTATGAITNTATVSDPGDNISPVSAQATITVTAPPVAASASASSAPTTTVAPKVITVPSTHTGEPWSAVTYWWLLSSLGLAGTILIFPVGRLKKKA